MSKDKNNGYKLKFNIEITDESGNKESHPVSVDLTSYMSEEEASNIDSVEKNILELNSKAIRKVLSEHLENISKKKRYKNNLQKEKILKKILQNIGLTEK